MFKFTTVIILFFYSFFSFAEWTQFKEYKKGYSGSNKRINFGESVGGHIFYDKESIKRAGSKLYLNQLINFYKQYKIYKGDVYSDFSCLFIQCDNMNSVISSFTIHCDTFMAIILKNSFYEKKMGGGKKVLENDLTNDPSTIFYEFGSKSYYQIETLCSQY
ncbi:MAG: hypothetical protein CFH34_00957 [Alphaproteobacteria bacterium MarineAlpha9_Bin4]|nr:MAG: hypothetical protein CFH34_00957 [Alphaproteobacteria bacterium MarineAlpha9_Bin4]